MSYSPDTIPASPNSDDRLWAMLAHLSGPAVALISAGLFAFLGPLVIWLIKREESAFVDDQGKEAINFQLTVLILYVAAGAVVLLTCFITAPLLLVAVPLIMILQIVFGIMAAVKANGGQAYRYPLNIRFIK